VGHGQGTRYSASAAKRPARSTRSPARPPRAGPIPFGTVIAGLLVAWAGWLVGRYFERVEVSGLSMAPVLQPGDRLLLRRTRSVRPGDIVAAPDPRQPARPVLKRVADVNQEGVFLLGDNPEHSTDSRQFGPVPIRSVRGKAIYRYAPPGRAGKLR
jgi:nickel-type superoxide dismutase maturation protease